jgi:hypothetical protein
MFSRNVLKQGICIAATLALLLAVITPPVRSSNSAGGSFLPRRVCRNFRIPSNCAIRPTAAVASPVDRVKALRSAESEELLSRTARPVCSALESLLTPSPTPVWELSTSVPNRATQPLRC